MSYVKCEVKVKGITEAEWRKIHTHDGVEDIVLEDYKGIQPPTYRLEQLRCRVDNRVLVKIQTISL